MMTPDAVIEVRFLTQNEGGRESAIQGTQYGCPIVHGKQAFDCRFILEEISTFELGESYRILVKFLNPEFALKYLKKGEHLSLWEGKTIAIGEVIDVF